MRRWISEQWQRDPDKMKDEQIVVNYIGARMLRSFVREGPAARILDQVRQRMHAEIAARARAGDLDQRLVEAVNVLDGHPAAPTEASPPAERDTSAPPPPPAPAQPETEVIDAKATDKLPEVDPPTERASAPEESKDAGPA